MKQLNSILTVTLGWSLLLGACTDPPVSPYDDAPAPTGVVEGSVLYIGPPPQCENGVPSGRVILTLFDYNNPPPPVGTALSPVNMLSMKASSLFGSNDCGLIEADPSARVQRSAPFVWPNVPLSSTTGEVASYQLKGFFDYDSDFNPFFGIRKQPTATDIAGGAYVDPTATIKVPTAINFESVEERPLGQVVSNVTVTLAAPIVTERPMFELGSDTKALDSGTTLTVADDVNPAGPELEPDKYEHGLWLQTEMTLERLDPNNAEVAAAFEAAGIQVDKAQPYPWMLESVDFYGGTDGAPDYFPLFANHPILGDEGSILELMEADYLWKTPLVFFSRARTSFEIQGNVPTVSLIGTVRQVVAPASPVLNSVEVIVPPIALVNLDPTNPACSVPYLAPGNSATAYESRPSDCQELPTGEYDVVVFHGFAATLVNGLPSYLFSGQAWVIPNELGGTDSMYLNPAGGQLPAASQLVSQGPTGRYRVVENTASNGVRDDCTEAVDFTVDGPVIRAINFVPVPDACCANVAHLCDIPLCETAAAQAGGRIRRSSGLDPTTGLPTCIPFLMPASCCETAE